MMDRTLTIAWLYGAKMNIYGDRGNVLAIAQRARWRGIAADVRQVELGEPIPADTDIFFFGGGQDQEQIAVSRDLVGAKGEAIRTAVENGAALLSVCGGYQLLGHEYRPHDAEPLPGISLFDVESTAGPERFIGNVVIDSQWGTLVGFENHSGLTHLGGSASRWARFALAGAITARMAPKGSSTSMPLAATCIGDRSPNPVPTDWLVAHALERRHGFVDLSLLPDEMEAAAYSSAVQRAVLTR